MQKCPKRGQYFPIIISVVVENHKMQEESIQFIRETKLCQKENSLCPISLPLQIFQIPSRQQQFPTSRPLNTHDPASYYNHYYSDMLPWFSSLRMAS